MQNENIGGILSKNPILNFNIGILRKWTYSGKAKNK